VLTAELQELAADLVRVAYLRGDFVLRSGKRSSYYFDKYLFETQPDLLRRLGRALAALVPPGTQRLAAPELGAVLLGGVVSLETGLPLVLVRKEAKDYGTSRLLEGELREGEAVTLIEDVLTSGGEALKSAARLRAAGARLLHLIGVVDRGEGAEEALRAAGIPYTPLFRKADLTLPD